MSVCAGLGRSAKIAGTGPCLGEALAIHIRTNTASAAVMIMAMMLLLLVVVLVVLVVVRMAQRLGFSVAGGWSASAMSGVLHGPQSVRPRDRCRQGRRWHWTKRKTRGVGTRRQ